MAATREYFVAYDICDNKRLRLVHRAMLGYGEGVQYSVFRCVCGPAQLHAMKLALQRVIDPSEDQVLFVDLGPSNSVRNDTVQSLGIAYAVQTREAIVL